MICAACKTVSAKTITVRCPQCGAEPKPAKAEPASRPAPAAPPKDAE